MHFHINYGMLVDLQGHDTLGCPEEMTRTWYLSVVAIQCFVYKTLS